MRRDHRLLRILDGVKINPVIRMLVVSDLLILSAFGLLAPIFAIFLLEDIQGGAAEVVGFATMVTLLSRAFFQIPVAVFIDRQTGERDDFWINLVGSFGMSLIPLTYLLASLPIHIYLIQAIFGFFHALSFPSWKAIFTRHIDRHEEGLEWAIYSTSTDLGAAIAAAVGGMIVVIFGFKTLFIAVSLFSLLGTLLLLKIYPLLQDKT